MRTNPRTLPNIIAWFLVAPAAALASCAGLEPSRPLGEHDDQQDHLAQNFQNDDAQQRLQDMRRAVDASGNPRPPKPGAGDELDWDAPPTGSEWTPEEAARTNPRDVVALDASADDGWPSTERTPPGNDRPAPTLEQRIDRASAELAAALRQRADRDPAQAASTLAALSGLAMVRPDVVNAYLPDQSVMSARLTPDERAFVLAWGQMARQIPGVIASGDTSRGVARILRDGADRIDERALFIADTALCDRVEGFGIYRELTRSGDRYKFVAGRVNQAIVYVELDGFAFVSSSGPEGVPGHSIELTQDISLYEVGSKVLAWRLPAQDISDFSRNRRRDFFVIQVIKLPATLSVGSYDLKLSVRDRTTQAVAERIIGIDVVADASAIRGE